MKSIQWRAAVALIVCLAGLFYLTPTLTSNLPDFWKKNLPADRIHLGLDLQGGMHLVLEVHADKAVEAAMERMANDMKETLMDSKVRFRNIERTKENTISLELADSAARGAFEKILKDQYPDLEVQSSRISEGRETVGLKIRDKRVVDIKKLAVEQSLETIRNRVDQFGRLLSCCL